ncbi:hypothetical protein, partial [Prevotella melaninogenica]|uniref:hypothetical protein n=1 Tax=Prevotella melaninogenica TaxID=28132 RepID=UPI003C734A02
ISKLQKWFARGAELDFKRALVRSQKGTYCNSIGRFLETQRAYIGYESDENILHISINKRICRLAKPDRDSIYFHFLHLIL